MGKAKSDGVTPSDFNKWVEPVHLYHGRMTLTPEEVKYLQDLVERIRKPSKS